MKRTIAVLIGLVFAIAVGGALVQTKPNLSGTWVCVSGPKEMIGRDVTLKQDAVSFTIAHGAPNSHEETYQLDGKEREVKNPGHPEQVDRAQAAWDGDKVVITTKSPTGSINKRVFALQPDGSMLAEVTITSGGKDQVFRGVHKKK
jgi:hypothetical protein